jgi:hypothetical protein
LKAWRVRPRPSTGCVSGRGSCWRQRMAWRAGRSAARSVARPARLRSGACAMPKGGLPASMRPAIVALNRSTGADRQAHSGAVGSAAAGGPCALDRATAGGSARRCRCPVYLALPARPEDRPCRTPGSRASRRRRSRSRSRAAPCRARTSAPLAQVLVRERRSAIRPFANIAPIPVCARADP